MQRGGQRDGGTRGGGKDRGEPVLTLDADVEQAHPEGDGDREAGEEERDRAVEDHHDRLHLLLRGVAQVDHDLQRGERVLPDQHDHERKDDERDDDREHGPEQGQPGATETVHAAPAAEWAPVM